MSDGGGSFTEPSNAAGAARGVPPPARAQSNLPAGIGGSGAGHDGFAEAEHAAVPAPPGRPLDAPGPQRADGRGGEVEDGRAGVDDAVADEPAEVRARHGLEGALVVAVEHGQRRPPRE